LRARFFWPRLFCSLASPADETARPQTRKIDLSEAATLLADRAGGTWRKTSRKEGGVGEIPDLRCSEKGCLYVVLPNTLDDLAKPASSPSPL